MTLAANKSSVGQNNKMANNFVEMRHNSQQAAQTAKNGLNNVTYSASTGTNRSATTS